MTSLVFLETLLTFCIILDAFHWIWEKFWTRCSVYACLNTKYNIQKGKICFNLTEKHMFEALSNFLLQICTQVMVLSEFSEGFGALVSVSFCLSSHFLPAAQACGFRCLPPTVQQAEKHTHTHLHREMRLSGVRREESWDRQYLLVFVSAKSLRSGPFYNTTKQHINEGERKWIKHEAPEVLYSFSRCTSFTTSPLLKGSKESKLRQRWGWVSVVVLRTENSLPACCWSMQHISPHFLLPPTPPVTWQQLIWTVDQELSHSFFKFLHVLSIIMIRLSNTKTSPPIFPSA